LNNYLNPKNDKFVTTAMLNKEILPEEKNKVNCFNCFMIVFNYDEKAQNQKCFSFSSPKPDDNGNDLRYFRLPNRQKIMLNSVVNISTTYLCVVDFPKMIENEKNPNVKKNLEFTRISFNFANRFKNEILELYGIIKNNLPTIKFNKNNVQ
jgi:hypothetical protein